MLACLPKHSVWLNCKRMVQHFESWEIKRTKIYEEKQSGRATNKSQWQFVPSFETSDTTPVKDGTSELHIYYKFPHISGMFSTNLPQLG
jgi:hypothetical protein